MNGPIHKCGSVNTCGDTMATSNWVAERVQGGLTAREKKRLLSTENAFGEGSDEPRTARASQTRRRGTTRTAHASQTRC
jgi:hypothetical protein